MDPRAGLDRCGKSHPTGVRCPDRRLSYPADVYVSYCSDIAWLNFTLLPWKPEECVYVYDITSGHEKGTPPKQDTGFSSVLYTL